MSKICDIWSFGITLWEIYNKGSNPYIDKSYDEVIDFVNDGGVIPRGKCNDSVYINIIKLCCDVNENTVNRNITFTELITLLKNNRNNSTPYVKKNSNSLPLIPTNKSTSFYTPMHSQNN